MKIKAFVLSAGIGERLRPITHHIPKPLLPVAGRPILEIVLEKITRLKPEGIGLNLYWKKEQIKEWVQKSPWGNSVELFLEDPILGTGGALKNASEFLKDSTFLVHNSDILSDTDLKKAIKVHRESRSVATLLVHSHPKHNKLKVNNGRLLDICQQGPKEGHLAFTGIAIYEPEVLDYLPQGYSSIVEAWLKILEKGQTINTLEIPGTMWADIGTPESYAQAVFKWLKREGEVFYVHPNVITDKIAFEGFGSLEHGTELSPGSKIKNCIVMGARLGPGSYENSIIGNGFHVQFSPEEVFVVNPDEPGFHIGTGGSDRRYYRIGGEKIIAVSRPEDPDFERYIRYAQFLSENNIPVPGLISFNLKTRRAIFDDLGDTSLYTWLKGKKDEVAIEEMYKKVLLILVRIHSLGLEDGPEFKIFDYEHFRWESSYFLERFLKPLFSMDVPEALEEELKGLARLCDSFPKDLIHRDFQSQNIMIKDGEPYVIDFQGARIGPPAYDLVSLLWDPYYNLGEGLRNVLMDYYLGRMRMARPTFDERSFLASIPYLKLQRHMQALGAYGFLSMVKGKTYFQKYIPLALDYLRDDIRALQGAFPNLFDLICKISSFPWQGKTGV